MSIIDSGFKRDDLKRMISELEISSSVDETGYVDSVSDGIAICRGVAKAFLGEVILFKSGNLGIVKTIDEYETKVVLFNHPEKVSAGMKIFRTKEQLSVPVSTKIVGRVVDPFGIAVDGLDEIDYANSPKYPIEQDAPKLIDREPVSRPLNTGIITVDSMIPIGLGQRELILGDMRTGKTSMALGMIINQREKFLNGNPIYCFYVSIGQRMDSIKAAHKRLVESGAMEYTTIISTSASDSAHLQYIAPYAACSMAEFFMHQGKDCLIIFDDLSKHSVAWREIARLLKMPAGRDAFPADSFYNHSRLLERAASLRQDLGGGSITAIPIIETLDGDISAFIPTNVISITDGQIFLDKNRFNLQQRPAIDVGLSVSRTGGSAQSQSMRKVSKSMKGQISQYEELLKFAQFAASSLDNIQKQLIENGRQITLLLTQKEDRHYSEIEEISLIAGYHYGIFAAVEDFTEAESVKEMFLEKIKAEHGILLQKITSRASISDEELALIKGFCTKFASEYEISKDKLSKATDNKDKKMKEVEL